MERRSNFIPGRWRTSFHRRSTNICQEPSELLLFGLRLVWIMPVSNKHQINIFMELTATVHMAGLASVDTLH